MVTPWFADRTLRRTRTRARSHIRAGRALRGGVAGDAAPHPRPGSVQRQRAPQRAPVQRGDPLISAPRPSPLRRARATQAPHVGRSARGEDTR
ncbi:MAG: hypothetical protein LC769_07230 [Chloroflexi bacterium]|nr:hypothetical protein [Chloroflexota bacterium]